MEHGIWNMEYSLQSNKKMFNELLLKMDFSERIFDVDMYSTEKI